MASDDIALVTRAAAYAGEAHARQRRKVGDEPYVNHLLRVADAVARAGLGAEAIAAALLHDVVEDTPRTQADVEAAFPPRVADLVRRLTQWWPDDAPAEVKRRHLPTYYAAIREAPDAVVIKLLDRADNLWSMVRMLPHARGWAERYLEKSRKEVGPLADACPNRAAVAAFREAERALAEALRKGPGRGTMGP